MRPGGNYRVIVGGTTGEGGVSSLSKPEESMRTS